MMNQTISTNSTTPTELEEKSVTGTYTPDLGITFDACAEDPHIADYFIPLKNEDEAEAFFDEWALSAQGLIRQMTYETSDAREFLTHKDLALYSAFRVVKYLLAADVVEAFSFSLGTQERGLLLRIDDICLSLTPGHAGIARPVEKPVHLPPGTKITSRHVDHAPEDPRGFAEDFENEEDKLVAIYDQLRIGPWPDPDDELLVTGLYRKRRITIHPSDGLLESIEDNFPGPDFSFLKPEGCTASDFGNDNRAVAMIGIWALSQPVATCKVIDHVRLTVVGIEKVFDHVREMNVTEEFMFSIRTFGRSIRVDMEECFKLVFTYKDAKTGEDRLMVQTFPDEDFAFEPPMPEGWPYSHE